MADQQNKDRAQHGGTGGGFGSGTAGAGAGASMAKANVNPVVAMACWAAFATCLNSAIKSGDVNPVINERGNDYKVLSCDVQTGVLQCEPLSGGSAIPIECREEHIPGLFKEICPDYAEGLETGATATAGNR